MSLQTISLECPGCGAPISTDMKRCPHCKGPIIITSFNSVYEMTDTQTKSYVRGYQKALAANPDNTQLKASVAMCYLKLGMYDKAYAAFNQLLENNFDDSESFFYAAVCLLKGKRAFLTQLSNIKKIQEYLEAALMIEERGVYHLFLAYVKLDYYAKKALRVSPNWQEELRAARQNNLSAEDTKILFELLRVPVPAELAFV